MSAQFDSQDQAFMAQAIRLADRGRFSTSPNPRVGCLLVRQEHVVGQGWHTKAGEPHAEIVALMDAGERASGSTCYVSLEPCCHHGRTPPCTQALIQSGVARLIAAMEDPNPKVAGAGLRELKSAGIRAYSGLLGAQAAALNAGFVTRMRSGRPYIRIKLGASLDGRTAMASGQSQWITSKLARADVQKLRAQSCAILTGVNTVLSDDPLLTVRDERFDTGGRQPLRVVVDTAVRMPVAARMLRAPGDTLILTASTDTKRIRELEVAGAELMDPGERDGQVAVRGILTALARLEINELLVEAGPNLSGSLIKEGFFDELILYVAPKLLGERARGLVELAGVAELAQAPLLSYKDVRRVGSDLRITLIPTGNS
jgi:diaminohydroxyphosphoribosylaminopyrimidine deaminase/5-amino-6-(5-phosphoribosylamino)uracil reductase